MPLSPTDPRRNSTASHRKRQQWPNRLPLCHRRQRLNKQQAVRLKHRIRKRRSRQKLKPPGPDRPEQPAAPSSAPEKAPVSAQPQQPDTPEEEPPGKLSPGESVTAVLTNYGEKEYAPGKGRCFFVELTNRSGKREYWGNGLERTGQKPFRRVTPSH
ncbi:DNA primase TraC [Escherichia coli]|nr:DNA primase TraC [Escherichia coli]